MRPMSRKAALVLGALALGCAATVLCPGCGTVWWLELTGTGPDNFTLTGGTTTKTGTVN